MTARRVALWCALAAGVLVAVVVLIGAAPLLAPVCTTHYVLLGRGADRAYVELTVPADGVCVLDLRQSAAWGRRLP